MARKAKSDNPYAHIEWPNRLTLEWLAKNELPIYVRNTTRPRGTLHVHFLKATGRKHTKIPAIGLPFNLSAQFNYDTILTSDDFRLFLANDTCELVRPDIAWQEMREEGAEEVVQQYQQSRYSAKQLFVQKRAREDEQPVQQMTVEALGVETTLLTPRVMAIVEKIEHGDLTTKAALHELKAMHDELTEMDCSYVISHGPEGQIRNFAKKTLAEVRERALAESSDDPLTPSDQAEEARREAMARQFQQV